jgi:hypothetical protein
MVETNTDKRSRKPQWSGVRGLLVYCSDYRCSHLKIIAAGEMDNWPDSIRLYDMEPRLVCQRCGTRDADVRPNFAPARMGVRPA